MIRCSKCKTKGESVNGRLPGWFSCTDDGDEPFVLCPGCARGWRTYHEQQAVEHLKETGDEHAPQQAFTMTPI